MKAVHFGAGSIGRGFIGDLLHASGYDITFIDVDDAIIEQINRNNCYSLYLIENDYEHIVIDRVNAVSSVKSSADAVAAIAEADLITTSVLADNLSRIAPVLLSGLKKRYERHMPRVNVFACENAVGNSQILRKHVADLDVLFAEHLDEVAAFANTEVDRMVLASEHDGERTIDIGRDYELAIDRTQMVDPSARPIAGADFTDHLNRYIERKLFIINGGHAWAGFMGHLRGFETMQQFFGNQELVGCVRQMMHEVGKLISIKHGFTDQEIADYIDFALGRFQTPGIVDTVARVCRSPIRKIKADERLVSPAVQCAERGIDCDLILQGIAAAFLFNLPSDAESVELLAYVSANGIESAVERYCGIAPQSPLFAPIVAHYTRFAGGDISIKLPK